MCGRFTLTVSDYFSLSDILGLEAKVTVSEVKSRFNIPPSTGNFIFLEGDQGQLISEQAEWGLVPCWAKEKKGLINARIETAHEKPSFRNSFSKTRCVVPASGYYEWAKVSGMKQPYYFHRDDPLLFAGLYGDWTNQASGEVERSFCLLTQEARGNVREIHHRMPVILGKDLAIVWMRGGKLDLPHVKELKSRLERQSLDDLSFYPVSTHVNSPRNDDATCIEKIPLD